MLSSPKQSCRCQSLPVRESNLQTRCRKSRVFSTLVISFGLSSFRIGSPPQFKARDSHSITHINFATSILINHHHGCRNAKEEASSVTPRSTRFRSVHEISAVLHACRFGIDGHLQYQDWFDYAHVYGRVLYCLGGHFITTCQQSTKLSQEISAQYDEECSHHGLSR